MSIDFSKITGWRDRYGVVTQITDESGRVLWALNTGGGKIVLEVEKIIDKTCAGEIVYENEEFILLDIYPKKANGVVKITYGGLTKTLSFDGTNAQQVFFGTFNGVSDSATTPASGTLTIEGACTAFGSGAYKRSSESKASTHYAMCIRKVIEWGAVTDIPTGAFSGSDAVSDPDIVDFAIAELPNEIESIGKRAFYNCREITFTKLPDGLISIGSEAFFKTSESSIRPKEMTIPSGVTSIGYDAFSMHTLEMAVCFLNKLIMLSTTPPTLSTDGLSTYALGKFTGEIIVPKGCGDVYKTAEYWSDYANYIVEAQ